ncbi:MAG: DUF5067 domain-containing protein [Oscillospiraceae bacterium]|nr:DUF5067 domain-containing protein [Oscillospiraceae bacterium]
MKKRYIVLIVVAAIIFVLSPVALIFTGIMIDVNMDSKVQIEIDSYRLCENAYGDDVIIVKYLLKNDGKDATSLYYEGDFYVYQNGVSLTEYCEELPKECDYDTEDQYRNVKGGYEYYAEIAYLLEYPDGDVEVEVDDYGWSNSKKTKVFKLK